MKRWLCEKAGGEDVSAALPYEGLSAEAPGSTRPAEGTPCSLPGAGKGRSQPAWRHPRQHHCPNLSPCAARCCGVPPDTQGDTALQPSQSVTANWLSTPQPVFPKNL